MLIISLSVTGYSLYNLFKVVYDSKTAGNVYKQLNNDIYDKSVEEIIKNEENVSYETYDNNSDNKDEENSDIDWEKLKQINESVKGILYIPDTEINLPFVQGYDNQYYLHHSIDGTESTYGTLFMECRLNKGLKSENVIIYGHNMKNGSMFGGLNKYMDEGYAKKHNILYVLEENGITEYEVFAVYTTENGSNTYTTRFSNSLNFRNYKKNMQYNSIYDFNVNIDNDNPVITLSTCYSTGETMRTVIQAQKI